MDSELIKNNILILQKIYLINREEVIIALDEVDNSDISLLKLMMICIEIGKGIKCEQY
jgi:hypothetical protein